MLNAKNFRILDKDALSKDFPLKKQNLKPFGKINHLQQNRGLKMISIAKKASSADFLYDETAPKGNLILLVLALPFSQLSCLSILK